MKVIDAVQGTPEWLAARAGRVTASMISAVLMKPETAGFRDYQAQLVAEILTGKPQGSDYTNVHMQYGTETEPLARSAYEAETGFSVNEVGLCIHPTIERAGASPDGLVGNSGLTEIKCPKVATHLACTGRDWCDFVSFRPDLPEHLQLFIVRFKRDSEKILELETAVISFLSTVDAMITKLKKV